ncbi:hypothetical protein JHS3_14090 [Jeongeupia sp. HS-3]|uniref:hypothetical protein n=1 Tax=Jeongeupia sp. HS-3 TaxID=1009682 RepID=UPI0018A4D8F3|nr:hypothetical protein [Jeongeupia sp. HS-3]BCL75673.1 hypothetical protein JHS3_14090 [Jeongeupia sp. HS-3]
MAKPESRAVVLTAEFVDMAALSMASIEDVLPLLAALEALPDDAGKHMRSIGVVVRQALENAHNDIDCLRESVLTGDRHA